MSNLRSNHILMHFCFKLLVLIKITILVAQASEFNDLIDEMNYVKLVWNLDDPDYSEGGKNWDGLCKDGKSQSPVDIEIDRIADLQTAYLTHDFPDVKDTSLLYRHDKLDTTYTDGGLTYKIDDKELKWKTIQFHFHAPSEHHVNGKQYAAEMHFRTHLLNNDSEILTLAIFLQEDNDTDDNPFFEELELKTLNQTNQTIHLHGVNITNFFEPLKGSNILKYKGSRTRPP